VPPTAGRVLVVTGLLCMVGGVVLIVTASPPELIAAGLLVVAAGFGLSVLGERRGR
jgi:hypothetical protein